MKKADLQLQNQKQEQHFWHYHKNPCPKFHALLVETEDLTLQLEQMRQMQTQMKLEEIEIKQNNQVVLSNLD